MISFFVRSCALPFIWSTSKEITQWDLQTALVSTRNMDDILSRGKYNQKPIIVNLQIHSPSTYRQERSQSFYARSRGPLKAHSRIKARLKTSSSDQSRSKDSHSLLHIFSKLRNEGRNRFCQKAIEESVNQFTAFRSIEKDD